MAGILLHIGYHKTATTWLQQVLFNNTEMGFYSPWNRGQITNDFIKLDALTFDSQAARTKYENGISEAAKNDMIATLSHERLSGYPASGGFDSKLIADRLFTSFGDASVLIIIREQKSIIRSWYAQYIKDGGGVSLKRFLDLPPEDLFRMPLFSRNFYKYDALIKYYQKFFTKDRVLVLPFEMLATDPTSFVDRIVEFTGIEKVPSISVEPYNKGKGVLRSMAGRYGNRLFSLNQLNSCALVDWPWMNKKIWGFGALLSRVTPSVIEDNLEQRTRAYIKQYVGDCYRESNLKTSELIDIDLSALNYDC
jgi:hypothetical protein